MRPAKREDALAAADAELAQHVREPRRQPREVGVGQVAAPAALREPAERDALAAASRHVAVDRLVRDVEPAAAGQPVEVAPGGIPRERAASLVVVSEVGRLGRGGLPSHY